MRAFARVRGSARTCIIGMVKAAGSAGAGLGNTQHIVLMSTTGSPVPGSV